MAEQVAAREVGIVQAGVGVLDGGGGDVCEDGTKVFGKAMEAAEAEFEPGDGVVEFVLVLGMSAPERKVSMPSRNSW